MQCQANKNCSNSSNQPGQYFKNHFFNLTFSILTFFQLACGVLAVAAIPRIFWGPQNAHADSNKAYSSASNNGMEMDPIDGILFNCRNEPSAAAQQEPLRRLSKPQPRTVVRFSQFFLVFLRFF